MSYGYKVINSNNKSYLLVFLKEKHIFNQTYHWRFIKQITKTHSEVRDESVGIAKNIDTKDKNMELLEKLTSVVTEHLWEFGL